MDKFLKLGRYLLALPMLIYPVFHFIYPSGVASFVPPWIPWRLFWTYFTGVSIMAAGVSIVLKKYSYWAAILLGIEIFLLVLLIHMPLLFHRPGNAWAERAMFGDVPGRLNNAFKDFGLSGAVFIFAGSQSKAWQASGKDRILTLGRLILGIAMLAFGILHFIYPAFAPGIQPMFSSVSCFLPGHLFWVYLTGAVLSLGGAGILLNWHARLLATVLGMVTLFFDLLTWGPRFFANPGDVAGNWLKDLGVIGGLLILAAAVPSAGEMSAVEFSRKLYNSVFSAPDRRVVRESSKPRSSF